MIEQRGDGLRDANGSEDPGAEQGVAAEAIVEGVEGPGDVDVDPRNVLELFESEGRDGTFVTFTDPLERQVIAVGVYRVR